jgi:hypothetical protein
MRSSSSILIRYISQAHDTTHAGQGHRAQMQQLQHQVEQLTRGLMYKEEQAHHQAQQIAKLSGSSCELSSLKLTEASSKAGMLAERQRGASNL